jgi:uncharacterized protein (UPF0218 family)
MNPFENQRKTHILVRGHEDLLHPKENITDYTQKNNWQ